MQLMRRPTIALAATPLWARRDTPAATPAMAPTHTHIEGIGDHTRGHTNEGKGEDTNTGTSLCADSHANDCAHAGANSHTNGHINDGTHDDACDHTNADA